MARANFGGGALSSLKAVLEADAGAPMMLRVEQIEEDAEQPRSMFDSDELSSLAASIRLVGVLQPVGVMGLGEGRYRLVYGARRLRAAVMAGLSVIPAYRVDGKQLGVQAQVVENQLRANLSNTDLARAIERLSSAGMKVREIAVITGLPEWRLRHFRAVSTLPSFLMERLDSADMRALYELQGAWEKAKPADRTRLEAAVAAHEFDNLSVTDARRILRDVLGKAPHSIPLSRMPVPSGAELAPPPSVAAGHGNAAPRRSPRILVELDDGRSGTLQASRWPTEDGHVVVFVQGQSIEVRCTCVRLVAVE